MNISYSGILQILMTNEKKNNFEITHAKEMLFKTLKYI